LLAIADEKRASSRGRASEAQAARCGEIQRIVKARNVGDYRCNRTAGYRLLHCPEQFHDRLWTGKDEMVGGNAEMGETDAIRHPHLLGFVSQLQNDEARSIGTDQSLGQGKGKAQGRCAALLF
jgi:hypothetical protein